MESGMFTLRCPQCHGPLGAGHDGDQHCVPCGRTYALRFGWLLPVDTPAPGAVSPPDSAVQR
jgi:hypothetical protein